MNYFTRSDMKYLIHRQRLSRVLLIGKAFEISGQGQDKLMGSNPRGNYGERDFCYLSTIPCIYLLCRCMPWTRRPYIFGISYILGLDLVSSIFRFVNNSCFFCILCCVMCSTTYCVVERLGCG